MKRLWATGRRISFPVASSLYAKQRFIAHPHRNHKARSHERCIPDLHGGVAARERRSAGGTVVAGGAPGADGDGGCRAGRHRRGGGGRAPPRAAHNVCDLGTGSGSGGWSRAAGGPAGRVRTMENRSMFLCSCRPLYVVSRSM
jgi:hypothetical protein